MTGRKGRVESNMAVHWASSLLLLILLPFLPSVESQTLHRAEKKSGRGSLGQYRVKGRDREKHREVISERESRRGRRGERINIEKGKDTRRKRETGEIGEGRQKERGGKFN